MQMIALGLLLSTWSVVTASAGVTFSKDVAPILYQRCVECHRKGEAAPMPLTTYQEVRPWAKAIKEAVARRRMPPWLADGRYGHFSNNRSLSPNELETVVAWVDAGAPKGEDADLPPLPRFTEGWAMGTQDLVIPLPHDEDVPAEGVIAYRHITVPTNFTEDKWVQAAEIRPGTRDVVHHVIVFIQEPGATGGGEGRLGNKLVGFAPGEQPKILPPGYARLVKAGSKLIFQLHYTTNGKPAKDRTSVGMIFAKQPVEHRVVTGTALNARFVIPPGEPNHEVRSSWDRAGGCPHRRPDAAHARAR
jgi:hypothetical protein